MKDYLTGLLHVLILSKRTQAALALGAVLFIGICLFGDFYVSRIHLEGQPSGIEQVVISKLMKRYDKAALIVLISFWALALKFHLRDKHRYL